MAMNHTINKLQLYLLMLISTLCVAILSILITPPSVSAVFDPGVVEEAKRDFPDNQPSSSPSTSPVEGSNQTESNDVSTDQSSQSLESPEVTSASNKSDESLNTALYVAGGVAAFIIVAGISLFFLKRHKK